MSDRDNQARVAANQILYGSIDQHSLSNGTQSTKSMDSVETVIRNVPISPLRRAFCLLVLFDLIVSVILWLIHTEVKSDGDNTMAAFKKEVVAYTFCSSLFDTVMLSTFRFVTLLLPYALFRSKYPWFVAGTTLVSSVFMLCKVILYKYDKTGNAGLQIIAYIVLISSVVISWVETWLMDLKVLPTEKKEMERLLAARERAAHEHTENSPLLSRLLRPARTEESYYSPVHSDSDDQNQDSDDEARSFHSAATSRSHSRTHSLTSSMSQGTHYKTVITEAQRIAIQLADSDDWNKESGTDETEGIVYSKHTKTYGKIFKLVAVIDIDALSLYNDLVDNAEAIPKWNPTVLEVRTLETVDDNTEITYNIAAEGAAGMVSSRDFVVLRHWEQLDGWYITSSVSVDLPSMPPHPKYVRGEQRPGVIRLKHVDTNKVFMEWLLNSNLKGWLPQYLIDQALSGVLMTYLVNLRKHAATLTQ